MTDPGELAERIAELERAVGEMLAEVTNKHVRKRLVAAEASLHQALLNARKLELAA